MNSMGTTRAALVLATALWTGSAVGQLKVDLPQAPALVARPIADAAAYPLENLAWLAGCWLGEVNRRQFREQWMPLRGELLVGVSQTVFEGKTESFEYLRLERRFDGVNYVAQAGADAASVFRLARAGEDGEVRVFVFVNPRLEFPREITYRKEKAGWLFATVAGKVGGADKEVVYPMRRINCETGELIK